MHVCKLLCTLCIDLFLVHNALCCEGFPFPPLSVIRLAFMHIIKREIEQVVLEWNNHSIRRSSCAAVPSGSPEELFFMPSLLGGLL